MVGAVLWRHARPHFLWFVPGDPDREWPLASGPTAAGQHSFMAVYELQHRPQLCGVRAGDRFGGIVAARYCIRHAGLALPYRAGFSIPFLQVFPYAHVLAGIGFQD